MSSDIKFTYFNVIALGESVRWLLKYGGIEFSDIRVKEEDWPALKPSTPFGQIPVYEENGKVAHQSLAIARYLAKRVKLAGANDWEDLEIDAIVDTIYDFRGKFSVYFYEEDQKIKESKKAPLFDEAIPFYLTKFEDIVKKNNGYLAVGKLTWADILFVSLIDYFNVMANMKDIIKNYPNLTKLYNTVRSLPDIKAWIEIRPSE